MLGGFRLDGSRDLQLVEATNDQAQKLELSMNAINYSMQAWMVAAVAICLPRVDKFSAVQGLSELWA